MSHHPIVADLEWRKTAKRYDPTKRVSEEHLEVLYEALRLSPSSINSQPWKFIVIESDEAKRRMETTFERQFTYNKRHVMESSHVILLAHNPSYTRDDFAKVVDKDVANARTKAEAQDAALAKFAFAELYTDELGNTASWTKAQTYLALGNALHALARLRIDATPMEGVDSELIGEEFSKELGGYSCEVALAIGYHHPDDRNANLPKSRLSRQDVLQVI